MVLSRSTRFPRGAHLVDRGLVGCPVLGRDVEVDACFACGQLRSVEVEGPGTRSYVVCRGRPASSVGAPGAHGDS